MGGIFERGCVYIAEACESLALPAGMSDGQSQKVRPAGLIFLPGSSQILRVN